MGQSENAYIYYSTVDHVWFDHASVIVGWDENYSKDSFQNSLG